LTSLGRFAFAGTLERIRFVLLGAIVEFAFSTVLRVLTIARAFGVICVALTPSSLLSTALPQAVGLVEQFESTTAFWEQFEVAKKIVALHDKSVLPRLELWLRCEDMRRRGNAAFVFARLGDDRGLEVIQAILEDRSRKRAVFEIDSAGHPSPALQIRADRYYAAHLLGDVKDVRAVPILIPLLKDEDIKEVVPWSLAEIGDKSAIPPLKEALADKDLTMRASALRALEKLEQ
jgi:HEAT repeat protein